MSRMVQFRKKKGPTYTRLFFTNFEEFANGVAPGGTTGWGQVATNTATMRPLTTNAYAAQTNKNGAVRGMVVASPASAVANSRINRTETPPRASMYCDGLFFFGTGGARAGLSFHGATGSGATHVFYIQNVSGVDRLFWGVMASGTTTTTNPVLTGATHSGTTGVPVTNFTPQDGSGSTAKGYDLMARAISTSQVELWINGVLVATMTTSGNTTGQVAGLYLASGSAAACEEFEVGTWAA